jgi:nucleotide-binding universal stress UspA family protein
MGIDQQREIPYQEAVAHWYEHVYLPFVSIIHDQGILYDFPGRTEADLYLWIGRHRSDLEELLGWDVPLGPAAADFASTEGKDSGNVFSRVGQRVLEIVIPEELEGAPKAGQWRRERAAEDERLFPEILVGLSGEESSWLALEQAIPIAERENGRVSGLYVVQEEDERESDQAAAIRDRFYWRCGEVGLEGRFATDVGQVAGTLCSRARWSDLLVVNLAHRPGESPRARWTSGFRTLLRRCSRPILAVPERSTSLMTPMLVYDGSAQANEALYVTAYLSARWRLQPVVHLIQDGDALNLEQAQSYLDDHAVSASYYQEGTLDPASVLALATERGCDFIVIGTADSNLMVSAVAGSTLVGFLSSTTIPIMICR